MALYGFVAFSGAFLLFLVQPLIGKFILPWFGGASTVWTSCLLVFQVLLLAGYGYAYLSTRWLRPRAQLVLHLVLLLAAIALLPITPTNSWQPHSAANPTLRICLMLTASLGLPFIVVAATAPLLQFWFSLAHRGTSPFRLYALSNAGSLSALLVYPSFLERHFNRATQAKIWGAGLSLFALACAWAAFRLWKTVRAPQSSDDAHGLRQAAPASKVLWLLLPACASLLLLAVTNKICQDLAPIALLWILPLTAYLTSFILCFTTPRLYDRRLFGPALLLSLAVITLIISGWLTLSAPAQVIIFCLSLFICCTVCHGELYRLKPEPAHLPGFYLALSTGGALGGIFVAVIAPRIFSDYFELQFGLLLCGVLFLVVWWPEVRIASRNPWARAVFGVSLAVPAASVIVFWEAAHRNDAIRIYRARDFYAVLNVYRHRSPDPAFDLIELLHGHVTHGVQFSDTNRARIPTLYYTPESGLGRAMALLPHGKLRIGAVGLGAGTVAAYLRPGDEIRFYEINPEVERVSKRFFTFMRDCRGKCEVILGDARLSLENEPPQDFDLLVLDAFNSDSIPIHLLTREAFNIYARHLKTTGVIAVNISNMSLDLEPVVTSSGRQLGYTTTVIEQPVANEAEGVLPSRWVLLSHHPNLSGAISLYAAKRDHLASAEGPVWTDDFNSLFAVVRWRELLGGRSGSGAVPTVASSGELTQAKAGRNTKKTGPEPELEIQRFREEITRNPSSSVALNNLACLLATAADPRLRNGPEAVTLAEKACALTRYQNTSVVSTLAAAYAEAGRFEEAVATAEKACAMAAEKGEPGLLTGNQQMLQYYRNKRPFHQASYGYQSSSFSSPAEQHRR